MSSISINDLINAEADVRHLAEIATSMASTSTDRMGRTKRTLTGLSLEFPDAAGNAAAALVSATLAGTARIAAEAAMDAVRQSKGVFATTADALSRGVYMLTSVVAGAGGANGTFPLAFSGGAGSGAAGTFTVAAGALVASSILITAYGRGYTAAPAVSFAASAGLVGASATAVVANNTEPGEYFSVPPVDSSDYLVLYLNSAGVAVEQKRYPSSAYVAGLRDIFVENAPVGYAWSILDENNDAAVGIADDGTLVASAVSLSTLNGVDAAGIVLAGESLYPHTPAGYAWSILDQNNDAALGVRDDGTVVVDAIELSTINGVTVGEYLAPSRARFIAEINHVATYGQSLSIGAENTAISTAQAYDSLELGGGSTFDPLIEPCAVNGTGETPSAGTADAIKQLILDEEGIAYTQQSYQMLFSASGAGGRTIAQLSGPGVYFSAFIAAVQAGYDRSQLVGKSYNFPAMTWTQGEANYLAPTDRAVYASAVEALRQSIDGAVKAITGQENDVALISYQLASHKAYGRAYPNIALAQLDAAVRNANVHLATPMYHLEHSAIDSVHLPGASSRKLGFYYGLAYKRIVIDGLKWRPLMPVGKYRQGAVAIVKFNVPVGTLTFDTTLVAANTNMGFSLFTSADVALAISSVSIIGPDTLKIVASAPIPIGAKLQYAFYGAGTTGPMDGPRGNLRDTQGDSIVFDPAGLNYPAHNWCVMFEEIF